MRKRSQVKPPEPARNPDALAIPFDPINEAVLFAAVIVSDEARRKYLSLPADKFHAPGHAEAWRTLQEVFARGLRYDPATVRDLSGGRVDPAVLDAYVQARPALPPNLRHHVERVHWDAARIAAAKGPLAQLLEALRDPTASPDKVRSLSRDVLAAFDGHGSARYLRSAADVVAEHSTTLTKRRLGQAAFPYGFEGLDTYGPADFDERVGARVSLDGKPRLVPGAGPGMCTVVTGTSGSGKTTSVARSVLKWAALGELTLWGAWEQLPGPSLELLAAMSLGFSRTDVMTGAFSEEEQAELEAEMLRLGQYVRFLELPFGRKQGERGNLNARNLDLLQQNIADAAPRHFVADLFRRALTEVRPDDEELALYRLQAIAQEEKCHVTCVTQLRLKDLESRDDKRPTREAIKGSGGYIEVADTILAWHRPALFQSVPDTRIECHVLKQRYGKWPQVVELDWDPEFATIERGRTIEVDRPGEKGAVESFLDESLTAGKGRGKTRRK